MLCQRDVLDFSAAFRTVVYHFYDALFGLVIIDVREILALCGFFDTFTLISYYKGVMIEMRKVKLNNEPTIVFEAMDSN